jgi:dephospho-CoA kinase
VGGASVRLGLTGGIGSGKSTVASLLSKQGAYLLDADAISRASSAASGTAISAIEAAFGASMLTADRALDREKMRRLIYTDSAAKALLESIIHPLVRREIDLRIAQAENRNAACIVMDIPLLVESMVWRCKVHRILVVDCSEPTQTLRVMQRDGLESAEISHILASQTPRARRLQAADLILYNDGISIDHLVAQVQQIGAQFGL